jgi:hypothetical protein
MAFSDDELAYLRTKLGSTVNEDTNPAVVDDLETRFDRLHDVKLVVVEVLRQRLADIADAAENPLNFTVVGEYSQDASANVAFLEKMLARAEQEAGVAGLSTVVGVEPADDRWRRNRVYPRGDRQRVFASDVERYPFYPYYGDGYGR